MDCVFTGELTEDGCCPGEETVTPHAADSVSSLLKARSMAAHDARSDIELGRTACPRWSDRLLRRPGDRFHPQHCNEVPTLRVTLLLYYAKMHG